MFQLRLRHSVLVCTTGLLVQAHCLAGYAQSDASDSVLVEQIRHANVIDPSFKLQATINGEDALITTQRKSKASDADCKIEAVLIAKTVFDTVADKIQRVKVLLLNYDNNDCDSVIVKRAEVKLFGTGGLTKTELLSSLEITKATISGGESSSMSVAEGPGQAERLILLGRIDRLKSKGTNVSAFVNVFNQLEETAKKGDAAAVKTQSQYLSEKITEQEDMLKQAKMRVSSANLKTSNGNGGGSSGAASVQSLADKFMKGQLNTKELSFMGLAQRQLRLTSMLREMGPNGQDGLRQLGQVQSLLESGRDVEAKRILDDLDHRYGF